MFEHKVIKRIVERVMHQYHVGAGWGAFKNVAGGTTMYVTFINLCLLIPTAYATWFGPLMLSKGVTLPFVVFLGVIVLGIAVMFAFEYKVSIPSMFHFANAQWWEHENPMRKEVDIMEAQLTGLKKDMDELKSMIEKLGEKDKQTKAIK